MALRTLALLLCVHADRQRQTEGAMMFTNGPKHTRIEKHIESDRNDKNKCGMIVTLKLLTEGMS